MNSIHLNAPLRRMIGLLLVVLAGIIVWTVSLHGMQARQQGVGIYGALRSALHGLWGSLPFLLLWCLVVTVFLLVVYARDVPAAKTPAAAGRARWHRLRVVVAIGVIPFLLLAPGVMLYHLATGQWQQDIDLLFAGMWVISAAVFFAFWRDRPGPERLHALETGDPSRVNDERMQQVQGKAAQITIIVFLGLLVFVGVPSETIVAGNWPVIIFVEIATLLIVWAAATAYWNRRL